MTRIETAWLAGILEGEGCFVFSRTPSIRLAMTDEDVVARVAELLGKHYVSRSPRKGQNLFVHTVEVFGEGARETMRAVLPYMGNRRAEKINEVLKLSAARRGVAIGENAGPSKISDNSARRIIKRYDAKPAHGMMSTLAREHHVSPQAIHYLLNNRRRFLRAKA
jgi:hypothetical protein